MSKDKNELLDLHYASVAGSLLGGSRRQSAAARDAEPEAYEPRQNIVRRLAAAVRYRRQRSAAPETNRV